MSVQGGLAAVDIGTSRVRVVVFDIIGGIPRFRTIAETPSEGVSRGRVLITDKVVEAVENAIKAAETESNTEITDVLFNVSGPDVKGIFSKGSLLVSRFSHRVTEWDVVRVLEIARQTSVPAETEVVCAVPRSFFVDGQAVSNPIGLKGQQLEVEASLILAPIQDVQNLQDLARRLGLNVQAFNASVVAAAGAVLEPSDKGAAVVDIGAGLTDIAIFDSSGLCWMTSLALGGEYITGDISFGLQTSRQEAEYLKLKFGTLQPHGGTYLNLPGIGQENARKVNTEFLTEIIESRLEEIFQCIKQSIIESGFNDKLHRGIVFTGGVTRTPGFIEKAADYLKVPVRLGAPIVEEKELHDPGLSCSIGMIICNTTGAIFDNSFYGQQKETGVIQTVSRFFKGFFRREFLGT